MRRQRNTSINATISVIAAMTRSGNIPSPGYGYTRGATRQAATSSSSRMRMFIAIRPGIDRAILHGEQGVARVASHRISSKNRSAFIHWCALTRGCRRDLLGVTSVHAQVTVVSPSDARPAPLGRPGPRHAAAAGAAVAAFGLWSVPGWHANAPRGDIFRTRTDQYDTSGHSPSSAQR
jgi:hypothetical protein